MTEAPWCDWHGATRDLCDARHFCQLGRHALSDGEIARAAPSRSHASTCEDCLDRHWQQSVWLVLDTETTGLDPAIHEVVEVALRWVRPSHSQTWSTLVRPKGAIPPEATAVHGLDAAALAEAPAWEAVGPYVREQLEAADLLVGYNLPFDLAFIGLPEPSRPTIDVLTLVRSRGEYWPGKGRHRLTEATRRCGLPLPTTAHRAAADAEMTERLLLHGGLVAYPPPELQSLRAALEAERVRLEAKRVTWLASEAAHQCESCRTITPDVERCLCQRRECAACRERCRREAADLGEEG